MTRSMKSIDFLPVNLTIAASRDQNRFVYFSASLWACSSPSTMLQVPSTCCASGRFKLLVAGETHNRMRSSQKSSNATAMRKAVTIRPANKTEIAHASRCRRTNRCTATVTPHKTNGGKRKWIFGFSGRNMISRTQIGHAVTMRSMLVRLNCQRRIAPL